MYEIILTLHIASFMLNITTVVVSDVHGLLWVLGYLKQLPERRLKWLHRIVSGGLLASIVTGLYLFSTVSGYLLTVSAFYIKVGLVAVVAVNAFVIHHHMPLAFQYSFRDVPRSKRIALGVSGAVSVVGWVGIVVAAQFLRL